MKILFFSITGQTRKFVQKLGFKSTEINPTNPFLEITEPFILITPTYDASMTECLNDFIEYKNNHDFLKGIAGSGNRNFGELFVFTAKNLAVEYQIPLLFAFEYSGTPQDVEQFKKVVRSFES